MEDHRDHDQSPDMVTRSRGGPPATPRWNPTKEQINMLESLYRQGIRTPSADQIQQITTRLRAYGHIEGKNVFYWFQNHKARQRQKQKQESIAYINRFLHKSSNPITHSTFSPSTSHHIPCPNVVCGPYYVPVPTQTDPIGTLHQQYQQTNSKLPLSNATMGRSTISRTSPRLEKFSRRSLISASNKNCTLSLFPLSPTCDLQKKSGREEKSDDIDNDDNDHIAENITVSDCEAEEGGVGGGGYQPFYDFF